MITTYPSAQFQASSPTVLLVIDKFRMAAILLLYMFYRIFTITKLKRWFLYEGYYFVITVGQETRSALKVSSLKRSVGKQATENILRH